MTNQTQMFPNAADARTYLVSEGFEPFRKGLVKARLVSNTGRVANLGMGLISKTYQHSIGGAAQWGFTVKIEG